MVKNQSQAN